MKKNKFLKIAGAIFTMCLMTTCAIGTTFAKYTTGSKASDTARVAKWGVEVSASGTMFGTAYGANGAAMFADSIAAEVQASVNTSDDSKVVAPGTKNDTGIKIKLSGTPEVAFQVNATGTVDREIWLAANTYGVMVAAHGVNAATDFAAEGIYYMDGDTYKPATAGYYLSNTTADYYKLTDAVVVESIYRPIVWRGTVVSAGTTGEDTGSWAINYATLAEAVTALTSQINGIGATNNGAFAANETINNEYILTWAWAFDGQNNGADTILGNLVTSAKVVKLVGQDYVSLVENTDYSLSIACNIGVTATQVD